MKRAAILIGVEKSGSLPKLGDAVRGAHHMEGWAQSQGIVTELITDESGPVTIERINKVIRKLVDPYNISQLIVYFAGHGVNLQRQEYWLLSDAPDDSNAAVNIATSAALAATCGIPHVIFISDACRTAPEGVRAQSVRGSDIFPNREEDMRPVDQFFACQLGKPSHEVRDPNITSAEFQAIYTKELVPAVSGKVGSLVQWVEMRGRQVGRVHLRPLRDHLTRAVAARIADLNMQTRIIQVPVAQISSDPPAWICEVSESERLRGPMTPPEPVQPPPSAAALVQHVTRGGGLPPNSSLAANASRVAEPFGPMHHETGCGFKLRGIRVVEWVSGGVKIELAGSGTGDDLRVYGPRHPCSNVLLVLEGGSGVLLPAIPEFLCALTFEDGELVDVAYEPSDTTHRWPEFQLRATEMRKLRGIASAAMVQGTFKLEGEEALKIAQRMQFSKGVDPSLGIYAAYAYQDLQRRDLIQQMGDHMQSDLGGVLFDVALLARRLDRRNATYQTPLIGAVPLMSQGWPFLRAFEVGMPAAFPAVYEHRLPSLWTMFDPGGVGRIRQAFANGEIR